MSIAYDKPIKLKMDLTFIIIIILSSFTITLILFSLKLTYWNHTALLFRELLSFTDSSNGSSL